MEFCNNPPENFPFLFSSDGLFKDSIKKFTQSQGFYLQLYQETDELKKKISELRKEIKIWLDRSLLGGSQYKYALASINREYPSVTPPEDQANDETYQERYAIARDFISGWKTCIDKLQDCQKLCNNLDESFNVTNSELNSKMNQAQSQLAKLNSSAKEILKKQPFLYLFFVYITYRSKMDRMENLLIEINKNLKKYQDDLISVEEKYEKYHKYF